MPSSPPSDDNSFREQILDAARAQVRRHGEAKTNVVDIARALGTSHTTIYRHFRSKADIFDALVVEMMRDEEEMARKFVEAKGSFAERLEGMVLALHARKRERFWRRCRSLWPVSPHRGGAAGNHRGVFESDDVSRRPHPG